jgi:pimeloyl-ACP methyl ester carboxylesterase
MHVIDQAARGPNAVFLHGFCQSSLYWEPILARLTAVGFGGLAPDLPGFGASAAELGPYTMEAYADAIARLLDRSGLDQVAIVGGSMGGVVAQHFALRHPARLTRLLLVATGAFTSDPAAALAKADQLAISEWAEALTGPMVDGFFHRAPSAAERRAFLQAAGMANREAAVEAARSNARSRTFERLHEITVPTLIVQGRHDRARTPEHGAEMASQIRGAQLFVLEGSGHTPQIEEPEAFWEIAMPFLAGKT